MENFLSFFLSFFLLLTFILGVCSCNKEDKHIYIDQSIPQTESEPEPESCLPDNIEDLFTIHNNDTVFLYKAGYYHNELIDIYDRNDVEVACSCSGGQEMQDTMNVYMANMNANVYTYMDTTSQTCSHLESFLFSCDAEDLEALEDTCYAVIDSAYADLVSAEVMDTAELNILADYISSLRSGNHDVSDEEDLIERWVALSGKYRDGLLSGTILSIGIYSRCFWDDYFSKSSAAINQGKALPRFWPTVLGDIGGAYVSSMNCMVFEEDTGSDHGMNCLKGAARDGLATSAWILGPLL